MNTEDLKTKVFESLGTASMCWNPIPTGVFDDTNALKVGEALWVEIEKAIGDAFEAGEKYAQDHHLLSGYPQPTKNEYLKQLIQNP